MTVAELIAKLQQCDPNLPVSVNDEANGNFIEDIDAVFFCPEDKEYGDRACVTLVVNEVN